MELSQSKMNEARNLGVTVQSMVMADLMAVGYSENDAFDIAYPENRGIQKKYHDGIRDDVLGNAKFKKMLEKRRARIKDGTALTVNLDDIELVGTEAVMKEILRSAKQLPVGSKERADLFVKYNDIKLKSDMGTDDEDDSISFVFPLKCNQCPLLAAYNEERRKAGDRELKPVEMEHVIRTAGEVIGKTL